MNKILCLALAAILALSCAVLPAFAESRPLMYKVTDQEGHSIYLLGTMHVVNAETFPIARLDDVMSQVDRVILEVDRETMEKLTSGNAQEGGMPGLQTQVAGNGLSDAALDKIAAYLTSGMGMPMDKNAIRTMTLPVLTQLIQALAMKTAGYDPEGSSVDQFVFNEAKKRDLKVSGVETLEEQMKALGAEGANVDVKTAESTILRLIDNADVFKKDMDALVNAYNKGDKDALVSYLSQQDVRSKADAGRNAKFLEAAKKALQDGGRALIAIGVYHIIAEDGLANTLRSAGCTVEAL